jgi:hypothetical protein
LSPATHAIVPCEWGAGLEKISNQQRSPSRVASYAVAASWASYNESYHVKRGTLCSLYRKFTDGKEAAGSLATAPLVRILLARLVDRQFGAATRKPILRSPISN